MDKHSPLHVASILEGCVECLACTDKPSPVRVVFFPIVGCLPSSPLCEAFLPCYVKPIFFVAAANLRASPASSLACPPPVRHAYVAAQFRPHLLSPASSLAAPPPPPRSVHEQGNPIYTRASVVLSVRQGSAGALVKVNSSGSSRMASVNKVGRGGDAFLCVV